MKNLVLFFLLFSIENVSAKKSKNSPNILIVSLCSWKYSHLKAYGYPKSTMPNVEQWLESGAYIFDNSFNPTSWINANEYLTKIDSKVLEKNGYQGIGNKFRNRFYRIPLKKPFENDLEWNEMEIADEFQKVKELITAKRDHPFILQVHIKYLHYPMYDSFNKDFDPQRFLTSSQKKYWEKILKTREQPDWPFVFHSFLFRDLNWVNKSKIFPQETFDKSKSSPFGRTQQLDLIKKWTENKDFQNQLNILKSLYDAKLFFIDQKLKDMITLYDSKDLRDSTLVILTGDHGEAFMEHGFMGHGDTVYDEVHRFPLFIKFPGQTDSHRMETQVHLGALKDFWENIMSGISTPENAVSALASSSLNKKITMRNCKGDILAIRKENKTKFIYNFRDNKKFLFDLSSDPLEKKNLVNQRRASAMELESELLGSDLGFRTQLHTNCHTF